MKNTQFNVKHPIFQMIMAIISYRKCTLLKSVVYLFTCSVLLSVLAGCSSITMRDTLPTGVPRGYVEFYYLKSVGNTGRRPAIYSVENNKRIFEGYTSANDLFQNKVGFRLAKRPGTYDFAVTLGTADEQVHQVRVEEGMVTPVRIHIGNVRRKYGYNKLKIYFSFALIVEESTPINN